MKPTGRPALHRIKPSPWRLAPGRSSLARPACAAAVLMAGLLAGLAALLLAIPAAAFPPLSPPSRWITASVSTIHATRPMGAP